MKKIKNISIVLFFVLTTCYTFVLTGQLFIVQTESLENSMKIKPSNQLSLLHKLLQPPCLRYSVF